MGVIQATGAVLETPAGQTERHWRSSGMDSLVPLPNRVQVSCAICGQQMWRIPSRIGKSNETFCSISCANEGNRRRLAGISDRDRFLSKIEKSDDGCWIWTAFRDRGGYGKFGWNGRVGLAHRFAYEEFISPIPDGLTIDHLCRNPACVNPDHLEPVTMAENIHRGMSPHMVIHHAQRCVRGHDYATHSRYRNGKRICCRTCENENLRKRRNAKSSQ